MDVAKLMKEEMDGDKMKFEGCEIRTDYKEQHLLLSKQ